MKYIRKEKLTRIIVAMFTSIIYTLFFLALTIMFRFLGKMEEPHVIMHVLTALCFITTLVGLFSSTYYIGRYIVIRADSPYKFYN